MTQNTVYKRIYEPTENMMPVRLREVMRYARWGGYNDDDIASFSEMFAGVRNELRGSFSYQVCFRRMPVSVSEGKMVLPFECSSKDLFRALMGSSEIIMFAATVGIMVDRAILRAERSSPSKAMLMQAYGAERVESLCDYFCREIADEVRNEGLKCSARFSPGYGDLPIETQRDFVSLLDCSRQLGISLNESLLMTPSKSVTAIFGLGKDVCGDENRHDCSKCGLRGSCSYSKEA